MTLPATPVTVMVIALTRGKPDAHTEPDISMKSWIASKDANGRLSLWKTDVLPEESHEEAAARCLNESFGLIGQRKHESHELIACGNALTKKHRLKLFYLPWLVPHDLLKDVDATYMDIDGPASWNMKLDAETRLLLKHAEPGMKRQLDMVERPALNELYN